jgi:hypothetical protein
VSDGPEPRSGLDERGEWTAAFEGQRPPFEPGNELTKQHGAYSSTTALSKDERVAELADEIARTQPVSHEADAGAVWRLAVCYRRCELAVAAIEAADERLAGAPAAAYTDSVEWLGRLRADLRSWLSLAGKIEDALGRTPTSRAKLGLHLALGRRAMTVVELHEAAAIEGEAVEEPGA